MLKRSILITAFALASIWSYAQIDAITEATDSAYTIIDAINDADGTVYIYQPQSLDACVARDHDAAVTNDKTQVSKHGGYRIQVFSDNNLRTAKSNAEYRKKLVEQQTQMRAYITFDSPYWKVRVGDFRTQAEADAAMRELKGLFPNYAQDFRLVHERINVAQ